VVFYLLDTMGKFEFSGKREATHAGSWYDDNPKRLRAEFDTLFSDCKGEECVKPARAIVSPHAGYTYCGRAMARCYTSLMEFFRTLPEGHVPRVVIMGPSHHRYMKNCGFTPFAQWESPFGTVDVDTELCTAIQAALGEGNASQVSRSTDEEEHSLEMMLQFILYAADHAGKSTVRIAPFMVGGRVDPHIIGRALNSTLDDKVALVISSDFCHWGARFGYQMLPPANTPDEAVWQRIERLDRMGAERIAAIDLDGFRTYLDKTENTICGRDSICALLAMAKESKGSVTGKILFYDQSSKCRNARSDSSVSYCAIAVYL